MTLRILKMLLLVTLVAGGVRMCTERFADATIARRVQQSNARLPVMLDPGTKLVRMDYINHVLRYRGVLIGQYDIDQQRKSALGKNLLDAYCHGKMKAYADAGVSVEYDFSYQSPSQGKQSITVLLVPEKCAGTLP